MNQLELTILLLAVIVAVSVAVRKTSVPAPLALVVAGIILGFLPGLPHFQLSPETVMFVFLPLLIYQTAIAGHWSDLKRNKRPVVLLSVGCVLFTTSAIAIACHSFLNFEWPISFIIGAVLAPPDSIAIVSVAKKLPIPHRIVTILSGEGLFNDATAFTILKLATVAAVTHKFSLFGSLASFVAVVVGETLFGLALGFLATAIRNRIKDAELEILFSLIIPFLAYLPCEMLGGSGVLATAVLGFYMGYVRTSKFSPETRILGASVWRTLAFVIEGILFLWAGLNAHFLLHSVDAFANAFLIKSALIVVATAVIARFAWMYPAVYLPRLMIKRVRETDPPPPWRTPFLLAWCGMRGAISIAAALTIVTDEGISTDQKQIVAFLTFCLVVFSLIIQGLGLPYVLKWFGFTHSHHAEREQIHGQKQAALKKMRESAAEVDDIKRAIQLERRELQLMLEQKKITSEVFLNLERAMDFKEASVKIQS